MALPAAWWPAAFARSPGPIAFAQVTLKEFNTLIDHWGHPLGRCTRRYGYDAWVVAVDGQPVCGALTMTTVSKSVEQARDLRRSNCADLARIIRAPHQPRALRGMLRFWTDWLAPRFDRPEGVAAAVSYALPGKAGNLYRFDGWENLGPRKPWHGGATWSNPSRANTIGDGIKRLWAYDYRRALPNPRPS
jgi:hypothetical protein